MPAPRQAAAGDPARQAAAPVAGRSSEPAPSPQQQEQLALAAPTPPEVQEPGPAATPPAATPSPATAVPAMPDKPAPNEAASDQEQARSADEPQSPRARAIETIKRAITALFGGATDEAGPPAGVAARQAAPTSDAARELAEIEPGAPPSFDIVRIRPGGQAVIAGRAAPGAEVELRTGDRVIDRVRADQRGEWVAVPPEPLAPGDQELRLAARIGNRPAVESEEVLVVAVPEPPPPQPAPRAGAEPPPPQPAQVAAAEPASQPLAVVLPRVGTGSGRVLQAPGRISSDGTLALSMLDYNDAGRTRLRGEALPGAPIRVYVDNEPAGGAVVDPGGRWSTILQRTLAPGDYTLRLDQLGASGKPVARLETPFTRVSQPPVEGEVQVDYVIVQPGNSLWRIARRVFGQGIRYVHIYEANQAQIRDPDLIYPGQVFEIPPGLGPAG